jgi:hypothetical protein
MGSRSPQGHDQRGSTLRPGSGEHDPPGQHSLQRWTRPFDSAPGRISKMVSLP